LPEVGLKSLAFGMIEPGRKFVQSAKKYRYGFNGKEKDNEVSGDGNQYDYGFRIYNPRLGKFLSVDPLTKSYPWYTPYQFAGNTPIQAIDLDGLEENHYIFVWAKHTNGKEVVLKLYGWQEGEQTGKVGKDGLMEWDRPFKIYAHYPVEAFGISRTLVTSYDSEEAFANAKGKDFYKSAIISGADAGAEIGMRFGDMLAIASLVTTFSKLTVSAVNSLVEQKLAQYSANLLNKPAIQDLFSKNVKEQILKSGITAEAKLAAIESGTEGAHFLSRHGAQTTLKQQLVRATTGLTPDGIQKFAVPSTRFWSHDIELEALEKATASYKPGMEKTGYIFDLGKSAGEGYYKGGKVYGTSAQVQAFYNSSGEVISVHPLLPKQ
jgi:RHS repeat-associated protein